MCEVGRKNTYTFATTGTSGIPVRACVAYFLITGTEYLTETAYGKDSFWLVVRDTDLHGREIIMAREAWSGSRSGYHLQRSAPRDLCPLSS